MLFHKNEVVYFNKFGCSKVIVWFFFPGYSFDLDIISENGQVVALWVKELICIHCVQAGDNPFSVSCARKNSGEIWPHFINTKTTFQLLRFHHPFLIHNAKFNEKKQVRPNHHATLLLLF
jgi:hypothetical protein